MMPPRATVESGVDPNNLTNQLASILRESFDIEPKGRGRVYQKSYRWKAPLIKDGSPPPIGMDINIVFTLPAEFKSAEEEVAQMCFGPKEIVFKKSEESSQHMKPLYVRGHIDGRLISRMLVDGGAAVNLMSYSVFKKLGRKDDELVKTNLMLNGVEGNSMEARGVVSMELTAGSKSLATIFFVVEVQGNYSVILGRHWIHANRCIPSILHQFLIQ
jgi:hypothetical protein